MCKPCPRTPVNLLSGLYTGEAGGRPQGSPLQGRGRRGSIACGGCEGAPHLNLLPWGEEVGGKRVELLREGEGAPETTPGRPQGSPLQGRGRRVSMAGGGCEGAPHLNLLPWGEEVGGKRVEPLREGEGAPETTPGRPQGSPLRGGGGRFQWPVAGARGPLISIFSRGGEKRWEGRGWSPYGRGRGPRRPPLGDHKGRPYGEGAAGFNGLWRVRGGPSSQSSPGVGRRGGREEGGAPTGGGGGPGDHPWATTRVAPTGGEGGARGRRAGR